MSSRRRRERPRRTPLEREPRELAEQRQEPPEQEAAELAEILPPAVDAARVERVLSVVADPFRVVSADRTQCDVEGCPGRAIPERWEIVDLDTGVELPLRLCEDHQLAYLRA